MAGNVKKKNKKSGTSGSVSQRWGLSTMTQKATLLLIVEVYSGFETVVTFTIYSLMKVLEISFQYARVRYTRSQGLINECV